MPGLRLKLASGERLLINGAVVENGRSQVELRVLTPNTRMLRLRDALHPDDATMPITRVCYALQLVVAGELNDPAAHARIMGDLRTLKAVFADDDSCAILDEAISFVLHGNPYKALQSARRMIVRERAVIDGLAGAGGGTPCST